MFLTAWISFRRKITEKYNYTALSEHVKFIYFSQVLYYSKGEMINMRKITQLENRFRPLIELGIPSTKILMDLYFLGFQFRSNGTFDKHRDNLKYNDICHLWLKDGASKWHKHFDNTSSLAYLKNKNQSDEISEIIYESTRAVANRVQLAVAKLNLAGVVTLPMNVDDYSGKCGTDEDTFDDFEQNFTVNKMDKTYPLLRTINAAMDLLVNGTTSIYETDESAAGGSATNESTTGDNSSAPMSIFSAYYIIFVLIGLSFTSLSN